MWHSTTRHTEARPRLRLVILLNRPVGAAEYWKIVRCIAAKIEVSMELRMISPESERPAQLMFHPVQLHGQKFQHGRHRGEPLDVDRLLGEFTELLPLFKGEKKIRESATKAGDPHEKPGEIGAFCRTYDVEQAIAEFIPEVFEQCGNRYRYFAAEGADGAVVYNDGKFLYSHHGSDPYHGRCLNAWDLVRCHLFGELDDEEEDEDTPINELPSQLAMFKFARGEMKGKLAELSRQVRDEIKPELVVNVDEIFTDEDVNVPEGERDFVRNKHGKPYGSQENIHIALAKLGVKLQWDEFRLRAIYTEPGQTPRTLDDIAGTRLRLKIDRLYGFLPSKAFFSDVLQDVSMENAFHPVHDYLGFRGHLFHNTR